MSRELGPIGRRLSLDSVALMSSPSVPSSQGDGQRFDVSKMGIERSLSLILKLLEEQSLDGEAIHARLIAMDEKLNFLLPEKPSVPGMRRKMSMVSKKCSVKEKPDTPRGSGGAKKAAVSLADFDDIDQKMGIRVMKAAKKRAADQGPLWHRSQSIGVIGAGVSSPADALKAADKDAMENPKSPRNESPRVLKAFSRTSKTSKEQRGSKEWRDSKSSREFREARENVNAERVPGAIPKLRQSHSMTEFHSSGATISAPAAPADLKPSGICPVLPSATEEDPAQKAGVSLNGGHTASTTPSNAPSASLMTPREEKRKGRSMYDSLGLNNSGEASLSHLFRHRETAIMKPPSPRLNPDSGPEDNESFMVDTETSQAFPTPIMTPLLLRFWLCICDFGLRITGLLPLVQCRQVSEEVASTALTMTVEEQEPRAALASKVYNSLLLSLLFLFLILAGPGQFFCNGELLQGELCSTTSTATDLGVALGAWLAVWSCGGLYSYFKSARLQLQMADLLALEVESSGFEHIWMRQRGRDSFLVFLLWLCALTCRCVLQLRWQRDSFAVLKLSLYAIASGCILSAFYLQVYMWRGISLSIVAYARSVLEGNVSCREARAKWREVISCMRQISRMYQLTAASCGLTTVFVCFGALYDFNQGMALDGLPSLVVGLSLPGALYVAASATAHCTRLPSLVSMLDGDDELEEEYINLALFLSLSESGFFMWDTRVTLAVLQKFLYFTMAIVGTIGFQLRVLTF